MIEQLLKEILIEFLKGFGMIMGGVLAIIFAVVIIYLFILGISMVRTYYKDK